MLAVDPAIALTLDRHAPMLIGISAGLSAMLMVYLAIAAVFQKIQDFKPMKPLVCLLKKCIISEKSLRFYCVPKCGYRD